MASIAKRPDGRWRARYRDPSGTERARHFDRKVDAQRWLNEVTASILTGVYADPRRGRDTFAAYTERWARAQAWRPKTAARVGSIASTHLLPAFGAAPIASIRRTEVQGFVAGLTAAGYAPGTVRLIYPTLRQVFRAAVEDRVIAASPCSRIALPATRYKDLMIPDVDALSRVADELPGRWRATVFVAAGLGLRPGEVFGLESRDVEWLRGTVDVRRQLDDRGQLVELKTAASLRRVPLPEVVRQVLAAHLAGERRREGLVFVGPDGRPVKRNSFVKAWRLAVVRAGGQEGLRLHDMRHVYASALIAAGEGVKVIQRRMGHTSALVALDVYGHLWPDSDQKTRAALDAYLSPETGGAADSPRTSGAFPQVSGSFVDSLEKG
ncbi:MAG: tyrosine-type recombinase/integrase [Carbonactinosporaceae bacterium]